MNIYIIDSQTMEWPIYEGELRLLFPKTSLPQPLTTPPYPYFWVQETPQPAYNWITQGIKEITPINSGDIWLQAWEVFALTPEQIAENEQKLRRQNKQQASTLLYETDWTTIPDVANPELSNPYLVNTAEFVTYRNQLRQIAVYPPVTVDAWPTKPQEVWATV